MCINNNTPTDASIQGLQGSRPRPRPRTWGVKAKAKAKDLDFGLKDQGQGQGLTSLAPRYMADSVQSIVESSRRSGLRSVDTADYVKHRLQSLKTMFDVVSSVGRPKTSIVVRRTLFQLRVRLPGTHYLTASSSSRTLVYLNSFSSLIYLILLFDILLAPLYNL